MYEEIHIMTAEVAANAADEVNAYVVLVAFAAARALH